MGQHDQAVEPEVRGFTHQVQPIAVLGRKHRLGGLFPDLLEDCVLALGQQPRNVRRAGIPSLSGLNGGGDPLENLVLSGFHFFP